MNSTPLSRGKLLVTIDDGNVTKISQDSTQTLVLILSTQERRVFSDIHENRRGQDEEYA